MRRRAREELLLVTRPRGVKWFKGRCATYFLSIAIDFDASIGHFNEINGHSTKSIDIPLIVASAE